MQEESRQSYLKFTKTVEQGVRYAIAMLDLDSASIENGCHLPATPPDEPKPKITAEDKKIVEEYRAAAAWLRYQLAKRGEA